MSDKPGPITSGRIAAAAADVGARLATIERLAHIGTWEWEVSGDRVNWSEEMYRIFGWEIGSPIDFQRYRSGLHPEDRERVQASVAAALATGKAYTIEHRVVQPDGRVRILLGRGDCERDSKGRIVRLVGTAQDITELREAQAKALHAEADRAARAAAESAGARSRFLADASAELAQSLNFHVTLRNVARLAVPTVADWCAIDLLDGRNLVRLAVEHPDPARAQLGYELQQKYPTDPSSPHGPHEVLRTGRPIVMSAIPDQLIEAAARDERHLEILRSLQLRSYVIAPLTARKQILGTITLVYAESGRRYGEPDLSFIVDVAHRAATAIDNARLVEDIETAREQLQEQAEEMELQAAELEVQTEALRAEHDALEEAAAQLRATEHRYRQILDSVRDMIFTKSFGSVVTWANRAACEYYGMTVDELRGITDVPFNQLDFTQQYVRDDLQVFQDGRPVEVLEEPNRSRSREIRYFHTVKTPILDADGKVTELVGVSRDITDLKNERAKAREVERQAASERERLLHALEAERTQLDAANRAKSNFLAVMSHELRTPLNAMIGYSDLLLQGLPVAVPDGARPSLERIQFSARLLLELIDDILTFSRLDAGHNKLEIAELDLVPMIGQITAITEPLTAQKQLGFRVTLPDRPLVAYTNARKVRQILLNLISNAIKFTDSGEVTVQLTAADDAAIIQVRDTGIGIASENLERIFDPFWQVEQERSRRVGGTGLGLSVTRGLAQELGGNILVESIPGAGSTFTVRLPIVSRRIDAT